MPSARISPAGPMPECSRIAGRTDGAAAQDHFAPCVNRDRFAVLQIFHPDGAAMFHQHAQDERYGLRSANSCGPRAGVRNASAEVMRRPLLSTLSVGRAPAFRLRAQGSFRHGKPIDAAAARARGINGLLTLQRRNRNGSAAAILRQIRARHFPAGQNKEPATHKFQDGSPCSAQLS